MTREKITFVEARFNHGRWIVDCPQPGCNGAELYRRGDPLICGSCHVDEARQLLAGREGKLSEIAKDIARERGEVYPVLVCRQKTAIEKLCRNRPRANMNWEIGESLELLKQENSAHGVKF